MEFNEKHLEETNKEKNRQWDSEEVKKLYNDMTKKGLENINDIIEDISPFMYYSLKEENESLKTQIEHKDKIINRLEELYLEQLKLNL